MCGECSVGVAVSGCRSVGVVVSGCRRVLGLQFVEVAVGGAAVYGGRCVWRLKCVWVAGLNIIVIIIKSPASLVWTRISLTAQVGLGLFLGSGPDRV